LAAGRRSGATPRFQAELAVARLNLGQRGVGAELFEGLDEALALARSASEPRLEGEVLRATARAHYARGNLTAARDFAESAFVMFQNCGEAEAEALMLGLLG